MKFRMSIRLKLFLSHLCAILFVSGSIGTIFYTSAMDSLISGVKERLEASAALISHTIDADDLDSIRTAEDMSQPIYIQTLDKLRELRRMNSDIAYMYIMKQVGDRIVFVVDSDETERQAIPGQEYTHRFPGLVRGFTSVSVDEEISTDEWGAFLSGYAPLKNGQGEYLIGIDMRANDVQGKLVNIKIAGTLSLLASVALAFVFSKYLAARFMLPINLTIDRCTAIAAGRLDEKILIRTNDELDQLLKAFNDMSAALSRSERKAQETLEDLRRSRDKFETRVMQRTIDLKEVNDKLRHEIAQRTVAQNALEEAATTDALTRLLNRRIMITRLEQEIARSRRNQTRFTVVFVDLDHFKAVNDTKGHDAGDSVLVETAIRMKSMLRGQDTLARWGGEEFLILLAETGLEQGLLVAEKIRKRIAAVPYYINGDELAITASFGVAEANDTCDINQLIKAADDALYSAKENGRNRVETASKMPSEA